MTADQLRECREAFEKWMASDGSDFYGSLDLWRNTENDYVDDEVFGAWLTWKAAWNTRPTAVASHAEGDWRKADLWIEYAANGNIRYFTQDPESADVHRESIASEGRELVVYYTHPPRSGDEAMVVKLGRELFRFNSFEQWVNKAQSWFKTAGVSSTQFVCIDATGHICGMGKQFMSARDRNAFPVIVYHIEPEQDAAMAARGGK